MSRPSFMEGVLLALLLAAAGAALLHGLPPLIGPATALRLVTAGLAGVLVPVLFDRLDQDPAVASSVFVTMITDSMGFFAFLGLAVASGLVG